MEQEKKWGEEDYRGENTKSGGKIEKVEFIIGCQFRETNERRA